MADNNLGSMVRHKEPQKAQVGFAESLLALDSLPLSMAIINEQERYCYVNPKYQELVELPAKEIIGKTVREVIGDTIYALAKPHIEKGLAGYPSLWSKRLNDAHNTQHMQCYFKPYHSANGEKGLLIFIRDVTEEQRAKIAFEKLCDQLEKAVHERTEALYKANQQLRQEIFQRQQIQNERDRLFTISLDMICIGDFESNLKNINPAFVKILGHSKKTLMKKPFLEYVHPEDKMLAKKELKKLATGGHTSNFVIRCKHKNGHYLWLSWAAVSDLNRQLIYAIARDITHQKQTELALKSSETELTSLVKSAPFFIIKINLNYEILFSNQLNEALRKKTLTNENVFDLFAPNNREKLKQHIDHVILTGKSVTFEMKGTITHLEGSCYSISLGAMNDSDGNVIGVLLFIRDISDKRLKLQQQQHEIKTLTNKLQAANEGLLKEIQVRKTVEKKLKKTEQRLLEAQRISHVGSWEWDIINDRLWWSEEHYNIFGVDPITFKPSYENFNQFIFPEDRHIIEEHLQATLEQGTPYHYEHRIVLPNGEVRLHQVDAKLERDHGGQAIRLSGTVQDITERRQTEDALRKSEKRYRVLADFMPVGIFHADVEGRNIYTNRSASEIMGLSAEELDNFGWAKNLHPDDRDWVFIGWLDAIKSKSTFKNEYRFLHKDGKVVWVYVEAKPEISEEGEVKGYVGTLTDITKRRQAEEQLRQHQSELSHFSRLHTASELVSGIAHELNQPLTAIVNYIGGCLTRMKKEAVSKQLITVMKKAMTQAEFAGQIIHRLKDFLVKRELKDEILNINDIIREAVALLEFYLHNANVQLKLDLARSLPKVEVDKIHIEQVLLALANNGIEAMKDLPGKLTIKTAKKDDEHIMILVCDTGEGIKPELRDKIFQPFFTTKAKGMGIGLALVCSIVEAHHGRIWVEDNSDEEQGSRFCIVLPVAKD